MKRTIDITFHKQFGVLINDNITEEEFKNKMIEYIKNNPEQVISGAAFSVKIKEYSLNTENEGIVPKEYDGKVFTNKGKAVFTIE